LRINERGDAYEHEAERMAERVMQMPASETDQQRDSSVSSSWVQRTESGGGREAAEVPPIVQSVLSSPGQSLDASSRNFFEAGFGHDFGQVRVHTDVRAAESAQAVNALAYTVGRNVVFGAGQYAPGTRSGQQLLAHELTHVMQQTGGAAQVAQGSLQRQERKNPLDDAAKAIIAKAKDASVAVDKRGIQLVRDIIAQYYPSEAAKVDAIEFDDARAGTGLVTQSVGAGATTKGKIAVGTYFVTKVDAFARRVLQVGHELQHIDQYRSGLSGGQNQKKREFLAFHDEALAAEKPGTGRLSYSTRLALIDGALGYFYCLTGEEQESFASKKEALLKRREEVNGKAGNERTNPPTRCKTQ
jgi:hypothetical protein